MMAIHAPKPGDGKEYVQCPRGTYSAVCVDVVDLGMKDTGFRDDKTGQPRMAHKIRLVWQVNKNMDDGRPYLMDNRYTLSLSEYMGKKSNLLSLVEAWGVDLMDLIDDTNEYDMERLIGRVCFLNVVHAPSKKDPSKVYANLASIMPLPEGMPAMKQRDYVRVTARPTVAKPAPHEDEVDDFPPMAPVGDDDIPF